MLKIAPFEIQQITDTPGAVICLTVGLEKSLDVTKRAKEDRKQSDQRSQVIETLLCSEVSSIRVGIPWLPPGVEVSRRKAHFLKQCANVETFVRESLSTVSTQNLKSYVDDLQELEFSKESSEKLGIDVYSNFERYTGAALFSFLLLTISFVGLCSVLGVSALTVITAGFMGVVAALMGYSFSNDYSRRISFSRVLQSELNRRSGFGNAVKTDTSSYLGIPNTSA